MENQFSILKNQSFIDLCMYQFGYAKNEPCSSYGPFIRGHYLFHYVISGCGWMSGQDSKGTERKYNIRSGQGFLIVPDQIITYSADSQHPWEYVWIEFDGMHVKEALFTAGLSIDNPIYRSADKEFSSKLKDTMLYIASHPDESIYNLMSHLYMFFDCLIRSSVSRIDTSTNNMGRYYLEAAYSYINQNFYNDITVEDIANAVGIHRNYLGRLFRRQLGTSPQNFLISYRMKKAIQLLKTTKLPIKDISNAVGYPNQLNFSRAFKKVYGVSPRQWRDENNQPQ